MRTKVGFSLLVLVFISLSITGAKTAPPFETPPPVVPPPPAQDAQEIAALVSDLGSQDIQTVRIAIVKLINYIGSPAIGQAVRPLVDLLDQKDAQYDSYTRSLAVHTLGIIGTARGDKRGKQAIEKVGQELTESNNEMTRFAAANVLANTPTESVRAMLTGVEQGDESPVVRLIACEALLVNTNGQYSSATCNVREQAGDTTAPPQAQALLLSTSYSPEEEMYLWAQEHILLPMDPQTLLFAASEGRK